MLRKARLGTALALLLVVALVLVACGQGGGQGPAQGEGGQQQSAEGEQSRPQKGGTLTVGTFSDIITINPLFIDDVPSQEVANLVLASLYDVDPQANVIVSDTSLAAELPQISEDGLSYTVKLKDTPKWTDGRPVTAEDVAWTIEMYANPEVGSPAIASFDKVDKVEVVDPQTVRVTLKQVYAPFLYTLAELQPLPKHVFEGVAPKDLQKQPYGTDPSKTVTNGPWKWTEWTQKQYVTLERNENYWGPEPYIDRVVFKIYADQNTLAQAMLNREIDILPGVDVKTLPALQGQSGIQIVEAPGPVYDYLGFNFKPENFPDGFVPWASQKTRQAIAYAINRQGMVDSILKGHGQLLNGPFLPGSWADAGTAVNYEYNVEKAKQLLAEDGWQPGPDGILQKDGRKFEFTLQTNAGNERREQVAAVIQQNLKDVGIKVNIETLDFSSWVENYILPGKFQAILIGWRLALDPDAESIFSSKYVPPNGQNAGWYKNEQIDQLWVEGYSTTDQEERKQVYAEIARLISQDLPYVFLYTQNVIAAYSDRVQWQEADKPVLTLPDGWQYNMEKWWLSDAQGGQ
ncbi:extracellular solute-binding protein family 5 [Thermaerobacter marianensis DSM 12885]|uniref:Extracellular solute-binding protein family 5 n=1 Tax=Thermaerobacter marianensis (strain ATCC 700841 / DSM 12885 / JCM 10246 / 7p75a) TaxID=644966 RepID=E6SMF7_THEM7|nr:peptide-binding protein [Thermaerobacter marianensis]ADU50417.1 extracellular solute-binding protein family 5 [Thermaerobacter marianensis DSM 12885]